MLLLVVSAVCRLCCRESPATGSTSAFFPELFPEMTYRLYDGLKEPMRSTRLCSYPPEQLRSGSVDQSWSDQCRFESPLLCLVSDKNRYKGNWCRSLSECHILQSRPVMALCPADLCRRSYKGCHPARQLCQGAV